MGMMYIYVTGFKHCNKAYYYLFNFDLINMLGGASQSGSSNCD